MARRRSLAVFAAGLVLFCFLRPSAAADPDPWFGRDKALHFGASAGIALAGYEGASLATDRTSLRLLTGGTLAIAAGAGKEIRDRYGYGDPSWRDFTWDVIGAATGLGVAWIVDWLFNVR